MGDRSDRLIMLVGGFLIGVAVTLLFAPEPGAKVRRRLARHARRYAREAKEELMEQGANLLDKGREIVDTAAERGKEFLDAKVEHLKDATQKAVGTITHRGA